MTFAEHNKYFTFSVPRKIPEYWCHTPELIDWTTDQVNNISIVDKCLKYDHNYTHLANLGYEEATKYLNNFELMPNTVSCSMFTFNDSERSTIVSEVCIYIHKIFKFIFTINSNIKNGFYLNDFSGT